jgi:hypothetical protein
MDEVYSAQTPNFVLKHLLQHCITGAASDEAVRWDVMPHHANYFSSNYARNDAVQSAPRDSARLNLMTGLWICLSGNEWHRVRLKYGFS